MNKNERCLWIVGTFIDYGDMSLRELNARFLDYTLNYEAVTLSRSSGETLVVRSTRSYKKYRKKTA